MKALHKAAIIMKIALRFRKAIFGAPSGTRTQDPLIKSQLLSIVANTKSNIIVKRLEGVFRLFDLDKAAAGFHNAYGKKQHQQPITDCLQRAVDACHNAPDLPAFECLRTFGQQ